MRTPADLRLEINILEKERNQNDKNINEETYIKELFKLKHKGEKLSTKIWKLNRKLSLSKIRYDQD